MLNRTYDGQDCYVARCLEIVGERWSLLIVRNAMFLGHSRFKEFQRQLGLATNVLATRLAWLVEAGILERVGEPGDGEHPRYHLTEKGWDLQPVIIALGGWGERWSPTAGSIELFVHTTCRAQVVQECRCPDCEVPVGGSEVVVGHPRPQLARRRSRARATSRKTREAV
jgi:DNA-binding HxlR family transcriptional regulator